MGYYTDRDWMDYLIRLADEEVMATLQEQIDDFEEMFPKREWTLAKRDGLYMASSNPIGHVARIGRPNPEIIRNIGAIPQEAFEGMVLKTRRKYNVQSH